jgi:hypothetical protein
MMQLVLGGLLAGLLLDPLLLAAEGKLPARVARGCVARRAWWSGVALVAVSMLGAFVG